MHRRTFLQQMAGGIAVWHGSRKVAHGDRLFAVNEVGEYQGLPTGSVESYAVEKGTGLLTLLSRQGLALSATFPRHLAVSPDGRYLVVAVYGGGAYNVLPVDREGKIGPVIQALKEIGEGVLAHPEWVAFDASGEFVFARDAGLRRNSVFAFENGSLRRV